MNDQVNKPISTAISQAGGTGALARRVSEVCGKKVTHWQIHRWWEKERVPAAHCLAFEKATGISRHVLRPDIFGTHPE